MSYQTADDILAKCETQESRMEAREIAGIRKDIQTATMAITDALARYRKTKTRARSKKKATENPFSELDDYSSRIDIQNAYGYDIISEATMDRLLELWDLREDSTRSDGLYHDRVTDMLQAAINSVGSEYIDRLGEYDLRQRKLRQQAEQIARENNERTYQREHYQQ